MKTLLTLLCLLPTLCFSQGFGSFKDDQPFLAKDISSGGGDAPSTVPGLWYRWAAGDLASNSTVTTWVDRIQGNTLVKAGSGTITNKVNALWVPGGDAGTGFTITNYVGFDYHTNSLMLIFSHIGGIEETIVGTTVGAYIQMNAANVLTFSGSGAPCTNTWSTGDWHDFILCQTNGVDPNNRVWVDGAIARTNAFPNMTTWVKMLTQGNGFRSWHGYIGEIIIWTNGIIDDAHATALHNYRLDTYGATP